MNYLGEIPLAYECLSRFFAAAQPQLSYTIYGPKEAQQLNQLEEQGLEKVKQIAKELQGDKVQTLQIRVHEGDIAVVSRGSRASPTVSLNRKFLKGLAGQGQIGLSLYIKKQEEFPVKEKEARAFARKKSASALLTLSGHRELNRFEVTEEEMRFILAHEWEHLNQEDNYKLFFLACIGLGVMHVSQELLKGSEREELCIPLLLVSLYVYRLGFCLLSQTLEYSADRGAVKNDRLRNAGQSYLRREAIAEIAQNELNTRESLPPPPKLFPSSHPSATDRLRSLTEPN